MKDGSRTIGLRVSQEFADKMNAEMHRRGYHTITEYVTDAIKATFDNETDISKLEAKTDDCFKELEAQNIELKKKLDTMNAQNNASNYVLMAMMNMLCEEALTSTQAAEVIRAAFTKATDEYTADGMFKYLMQHHKQTQPAAAKPAAPDFATRQTDENGQELW